MQQAGGREEIEVGKREKGGSTVGRREQGKRESGGGIKRRGGSIGSKERQDKEGTSIFRPSTIVPFSFSLARSASALVSNVTNPKPCSGKEVELSNKGK